MHFRTKAVYVITAFLLLGAPAAYAQATGRAQLNERVLPVAAGALLGAATSFFVLPLVVPAMATVAATGASTTASPLVALVGASIGGFLGYELVP